MRPFTAFSVIVPVLRLMLVFCLLAWTRPSAGVTSDDFMQTYMESLSAEEVAGHLMVVGFPETELKGRLTSFLSRYPISNYILFKQNMLSSKQIQDLNSSLRKNARGPYSPLIMVDQEGGEVSRIQLKPPPPSALSVGLSGNDQYAFRAGELTGKILRELGFNVNLAPVVDLSNPSRRSFLGNRSFGKNPWEIVKFAGEFSRGLELMNIMPVFKHFPGHGYKTPDSHKQIAVRRGTLESLLNSDLRVFAKLIDQHPTAGIMTAHVAFPDIDSSEVAATYSEKLLKEVLRKRLAHRGLVITDDLEMRGAAGPGDIGERAIAAIQNGCDLVMVAWQRGNQVQAFHALVRAIREGRIDKKTWEARLRRILATKHARGFGDKNSNHNLKFLFTEMKDLTHEITRQRFNEEMQSTSVSPDSLRAVSVISGHFSFYESFRRFWGNVDFLSLEASNLALVPQWYKDHPGHTIIYYVSGFTTARPLNGLSAADKKRALVINTTFPGLIRDPKGFLKVVDLSTRNSQSGEWLALSLKAKTHLAK